MYGLCNIGCLLYVITMASAQDWLEANQVGENSSLVTPEMAFKSVDQTRQAACSYGDTRKWAVGTRAAREGLASAVRVEQFNGLAQLAVALSCSKCELNS